MPTGHVPRILVIDDDPACLRTLRRLLTKPGYVVRTSTSGDLALATLKKEPFDLAIVDVKLPGMDGLELCRQVVAERLPVRLIVLSGYADPADRAAAFEAGADDFVPKLTAAYDLLPRIEAHLRRPPKYPAAMGPQGTSSDPRTGQTTGASLSGLLHADVEAGYAALAGKPLWLSPTQYAILAYVARNDGRVVPHEEIVRAVLGRSDHPDPSLVRKHVAALRRKLGTAASLLVVHRGRGVQLLGPHAGTRGVGA